MFTTDGSSGIEVRYDEGTIWLTQKLMAQLFDVDVRTVNEHLEYLPFRRAQQELVIRKFGCCGVPKPNQSLQPGYHHLSGIQRNNSSHTV